MVLQIELDPATEARLVAEAEALGVSPEEHASSLLRNSMPTRPNGTGVLTLESLERLSRELSKFSEKMPVLPPEANNRESFYEDRC